MSTNGSNNELIAALARLEPCLETPVISGELVGWLENVQEAVARVAALIQSDVPQNHRHVLEQIGQEDAELSAQVEQLAEEDRRLLEEFQQLQQRVHQLRQRAAMVEPNEGKLDEQIAELTDKLLHWILDMRKQERGLTAWYMEAFNRVRGPGD